MSQHIELPSKTLSDLLSHDFGTVPAFSLPISLLAGHLGFSVPCFPPIRPDLDGLDFEAKIAPVCEVGGRPQRGKNSPAAAERKKPRGPQHAAPLRSEDRHRIVHRPPDLPSSGKPACEGGPADLIGEGRRAACQARPAVPSPGCGSTVPSKEVNRPSNRRASRSGSVRASDRAANSMCSSPEELLPSRAGRCLEIFCRCHIT
jgi:hypothetical protein